MAVETTAAQVPLDPAGRISQDIPCIHCQYSLRTLFPEQPCPECGRVVADSLREDLLRFSDPAWLAGLRFGMAWILVGILASLPLIRWFGFSLLEWAATYLPDIIIDMHPLLANGILAIGVWLATSPETRFLNTSHSHGYRRATRILVAVSLPLVIGLWIWVRFGPGPVLASTDLPGFFMIPIQALGKTIGILGIAGWVTFCICLSQLARRAGAIFLANVSVLAGAAVGLLELSVAGTVLWLCMHMEQVSSPLRSNTVTILMNFLGIAFIGRQVLIALLAILYRRLFRHEARLLKSQAHVPDLITETST